MGGSVVGNIVIEAMDIEEAKHKLRKRYPDCETNHRRLPKGFKRESEREPE